jgi:hypothetical protein
MAFAADHQVVVGGDAARFGGKREYGQYILHRC